MNKRCESCSEEFQTDKNYKRYCDKSACRSSRWRERHPDKAKIQRQANDHRRTRLGLDVFQRIKCRCNNSEHKLFPRYGARGIECRLTLQQFLDLYSNIELCSICDCQLNDDNRLAADGKTIDRINNNGHYEIRNVRIVCRSCNVKRNKGVNNGRSKLFDIDVIEIRNMSRSGISLSDISRQFDVSVTQIKNIVSGKSWKHIESE